MTAASSAMKEYFEKLDHEVKLNYDVARRARALGLDPETHVDIPLAANMAERVAGLISLVASQLDKVALTKRIMELEVDYGLLDWRVGLKIAEEVVHEKFCSFRNREHAMEIAIRVGFAYLTLGIVAAPLEGFVGLKIKQRRDGGNYLSVYYAGPVRGAGGTAAATSVILADYIRVVMGLASYDPTDEEVNRYTTEIHDYHERITNLQYHPSDDEIKFLVRHLPIEINGDPTEEIEVSNHKDLPRIETNRIRGGICLVLAEGVAQKAPKLWKRLSVWGNEFGLSWDFLSEFIELKKKIRAQEQVSTSQQIVPNYTYISDLVAGRPVLCHPMKEGGFRLRYGRTRVSGFSAAGLHPNTLLLLNRYIAIGTQLKIERPGKAAAITTCDSIDGPIVKLKDGSVIKVDDTTDMKSILVNLQEILYLGDILISYGDFSENGHKLVPAGYCEEWWAQEVEKATVNLFGTLDIDKLSVHVDIPNDIVASILRDPLHISPSFDHAFLFSKLLQVPLHPAFTYYWKCIPLDDFITLFEWMCTARVDGDELGVHKIILSFSSSTERAKRALEILGVPHTVVNNEFVVITGGDARCIALSFQLLDIHHEKLMINQSITDSLGLINTLAPFKFRDKCGTFIGARMGRPEKAKMRKLAGQPHTLFPVGDEGDRLRSFQSAIQKGKVNGDFPLFYCNDCTHPTIYPICERCGKTSVKHFFCKLCKENEEPLCVHGEKKQFTRRDIPIAEYFNSAVARLRLQTYPDLIKGVRGTSNKDHIVEHLAKGILRAKHSIYINKDCTTRYDMTELPLTHFKPREIGTSVEKLRELGYTHDTFGAGLTHPDQVLELKPQDLILPSNENSLDESSKKVLYRVAAFIDELLQRFYGLPAYYNLTKDEDLVGHIVIGLAPHISAGMIGRIVGFSDTQGCFAHPLWHAGLRRDCDGDECCVMLLLDALLNFSRQYLPDQRGAKTMDSPLVLTSRLIPSEVDDQSHGLDVAWRYPLQLYEAALDYKNPWEVKVDQIRQRLNTEQQYEHFGYTHPLQSINLGVKCSAYKTIPTMTEKLQGQIEIAAKIRAVDTEDVARLVIEKHFLKDIKGNLRQFSTQQFRCVSCNEKFRRPPLAGKCTKCQGNLLFTVSEGSVIKYLMPSINLARQFNLPAYLIQSLEITKRRIEGVFGKEKEKQSGLQSWA